MNARARTLRSSPNLYLSDAVLVEIQAEADRLDRSRSWIVQRAWKIASKEIRKFPAGDAGEST